MHDSMALQTQPAPSASELALSQLVLSQAVSEWFADPDPASPPARRRGRPLEVSWAHLWLSLFQCVLQGMHRYQDWWRLLTSQAIGPFAPVQVSDDALIKRLLQAGLDPLRQLVPVVASLLAQHLAGLSACQLAPFATEIVALDETT